MGRDKNLEVFIFIGINKEFVNYNNNNRNIKESVLL